MRADCRNSCSPVGRPRARARQSQIRASCLPDSSRMTNPVPPQQTHRPVSISLTVLPSPGPFVSSYDVLKERKVPSVEVTLELLALLRAVQLLQRLGLDLPDALARQAHHFANLLQSLRLPFLQPEAQAQDLLLLRVELSQAGVQVILERGAQQRHVRRGNDVLLQLVG